MTSKLLREAVRGIAFAAETCVLLVADGLGWLIEALEPKPGGGPAEGYDPGPLPDGRPRGQAYTLADLDAMRDGFSRNPIAFRAEPWTVPHLPGCLPMECAEGCGHAHPLAVELAQAPGLNAPAWVKAAARNPAVVAHEAGCGPDGCVPGCKIMHEKADRLAHAGYGNAYEDNRIPDPVTRGLAAVKAIRDEIYCGAVQPWKPGQAKPYICELTRGHYPATDHQASGADEDGSGEWCERWTDEIDELKR